MESCNDLDMTMPAAGNWCRRGQCTNSLPAWVFDVKSKYVADVQRSFNAAISIVGNDTRAVGTPAKLPAFHQPAESGRQNPLRKIGSSRSFLLRNDPGHGATVIRYMYFAVLRGLADVFARLLVQFPNRDGLHVSQCDTAGVL